MVRSVLAASVLTRQGPTRQVTISGEYVLAILLTVLVTGASLALESVVGHAAVSNLYLLLVVIVGLRCSRGPVLFVAASSALAWYTVFIPPRFAFHIGKPEDALIFTAFFAVAVAMGHLTSRLRQKEIAERRREHRTAALYELVQQAGLAADLDSGLHAAIRLIETLFNVRAALVLCRANHPLHIETHRASSFQLDEKERRAAVGALTHKKVVGKFTDTLPESEAMHLPLQARTSAAGVLSVLPLPGAVLDLPEKELLEAFAVLIGTILEKDRLLQGARHAEILEASERLQRALLQSVSHELKTPLSAVQAGIDALAKESSNSARNRTALHETQQALRRLRRVINNLLDMTRIESGVVHPHLDWCDVGELIQAANDLAADGLGEHSVTVTMGTTLPIVKVDQPLLEQCLCNLLLNAASNSPPGAKIVVYPRVVDSQLFISVLDEGQGIPKSELPRIFETFYRGAEAPPGGTGLGLAIVDGFVRAHGGSVIAVNRQPRGAELVITIPVEILPSDLLENFA